MDNQTSNSLEGTFHMLSRVVMVVPIAIIAAALILQSGNKSTRASSNQYSVSPTYSPIATTTPQQTVNEVSAGTNNKLDLNSSQLCSYTSADTQAQVSIKSKKIYAKITSKAGLKYVLLNGDCIYNWNAGASTGEKSCGLGQVVNMADTMSRFGLLDMKTVIESITQMNDTISVTPPTNMNMSNLCVKKDLADSVFTVPPGVTFNQSSVRNMNFSQ